MNPFNYQGPLEADLLIDRRDQLDALQRAAADRIAIRLAAPRRFGKTTLLNAHVASMQAAGHRAVRVDLSKVATVADAAARIVTAYATLPGDPSRSLRRWIARFGIGASVGGVGLSLTPGLERPSLDEARSALLELLDVPLSLHRGDGGLTVVCLDEFQDLLVADDRIDGLVRSVIQHHGRAAAYVFAGSQPSLMRALFADQERPFYGQARPLELPGLPLAEATEDVLSLFDRDGLGATAADPVADLVTFAGGHPQRTILLAHHLYDVLAADEVTDDPAAVALERALAETRDAHQAVWDGLSRPERLVCIALADALSPTGSRLASEHGVPRSTLQDAVNRLSSDERHVHRPGDRPALVDPLFAAWLRQR